jgi:hypothetical protein
VKTLISGNSLRATLPSCPEQLVHYQYQCLMSGFVYGDEFGRAAIMSSKEGISSPPSLTQMILGDGTPKRAIFTALVVGTVLTAINHGDVILSGLAPQPWKVILTYCVPYCVTTWGAITGKRAQWRRQERFRGSAEWSEDR